MPARRPPPLLLNSTVARPTGSDSVLVRKVSMSPRSNSPSIATRVDPLSRGFTAIWAASAPVNASNQSAMIHTLRTGLSKSCFVNADTFRLLTKPQAARFFVAKDIGYRAARKSLTLSSLWISPPKMVRWCADAVARLPCRSCLIDGEAVARDDQARSFDKLNGEINAGLESPMIKAKFLDIGLTLFKSSPAEFGKFV